jgi:hypothetical protein
MNLLALLCLTTVAICLISTINCLKSDDDSTTTSTGPASTSTAGPPDVQIFNFTLPKNASEPACLRVRFSLTFDIDYNAEFNKTDFNSTARIPLDTVLDYDGICNDSLTTLSLKLDNNWQLTFTYKLKNKNEYSLDTVALNYTTVPALFPNITDADKDKSISVMGTNLEEFQASIGNSFKCYALTSVDLTSGVKVEFRNYQGQPFISPNSKTPDFDTAIECSADTAGTSKLVPIIVGSSLAVLVVLVLVAYIIGRHKHRTGYQQV